MGDVAPLSDMCSYCECYVLDPIYLKKPELLLSRLESL
jgi:hypothetical protein